MTGCAVQASHPLTHPDTHTHTHTHTHTVSLSLSLSPRALALHAPASEIIDERLVLRGDGAHPRKLLFELPPLEPEPLRLLVQRLRRLPSAPSYLRSHHKQPCKLPPPHWDKRQGFGSPFRPTTTAALTATAAAALMAPHKRPSGSSGGTLRTQKAEILSSKPRAPTPPNWHGP